MPGPSDGSHTRLARDPTDVTDYRIRSNVFWIVASVILALVIAAVIAVVVQS
jgi:hypothetical protein